MRIQIVKYIKILGTRINFGIVFFISFVNYYNLLILFATMLDTYYQLTGGPYTMFIGLGAGAPASIVLTLITVYLTQKLKKRNSQLLNGLFLLIHLIIFVLFGLFWIDILFFTDLGI
jgi:hypothetical protein